MPYFVHKTCAKVLRLQVKPTDIYRLAEKPCPKCGKTDWQWEEYIGHLRDLMLDDEDEEVKRIKPDLDAAQRRMDECMLTEQAAETARSQLQFRYDRKQKLSEEEANQVLQALTKANAEWATAHQAQVEARAAWKRIDDRFTDLGNRPAVRKDAPKAHAAARDVQAKSSKNKLYIGDRQHVSQHVLGNSSKQARILDVPNWSPGLNISWVEGGIEAKAHFKLKLNQGSQYGNIPDKVLQVFRDRPDIPAGEFLALCKSQGSGSLLWFDKDGASRPTWTAMEIWCLLRQGYTFNFADSHSDGPGRKIVLVPPA